MGKLDGKIALITGATSGMGEAFAELFAKEGATVVVVGRNRERGNSIVDRLNKNTKEDCCFLQCDVSDENQVISLKEEFLSRFDHLDILVNNAGVLYTNFIEDTVTDEWKQSFDTNTNSVMYMVKHFMELIIKCHGNILNNTSIDGLQSNIRGRATYMYASSKAATIQFMKICALNYSDRIRVNCICPGVTETPFFTNRDFSRFNSSIPMGRVAKPEEIAKAALFLVSDDASYITGSILTVDGGASIM